MLLLPGSCERAHDYIHDLSCCKCCCDRIKAAEHLGKSHCVDFCCTPEMTQRTAEKVRNSECIIFSGGHFPTSEDPAKFKTVITPVLNKIVQNDPERRGQPGRVERARVKAETTPEAKGGVRR